MRADVRSTAHWIESFKVIELLLPCALRWSQRAPIKAVVGGEVYGNFDHLNNSSNVLELRLRAWAKPPYLRYPFATLSYHHHPRLAILSLCIKRGEQRSCITTQFGLKVS